MIKLKKNWSIIILIIASISIATALTAEYIYNILPCKMCVYQRFSYYGLIIISIIYILLKKQKHISYFLLVDKNNYKFFGTAQDHKKVKEKDK